MFAATLLPSPGQREPRTFFTIPRELGNIHKNTQRGWLCLLPHTSGHEEASAAAQADGNTQLCRGPFRNLFCSSQYARFQTLSQILKVPIRENLALSQDFLELNPSLYSWFYSAEILRTLRVLLPFPHRCELQD